MERPTDGNPGRNQIADPLETASHHTSESPAADKHLERAGRASGRGIWIPLTVVLAAVVGFLLWQRMAIPAKTADRPSEKPSLPADVILLNAEQRAERLHDQEALSTKDLQQAGADLARAQDDVRRSQAAVAVAENRLRLFGREPQELERVDPRVVMRAPISGTIVDRKIGPGQFVKPDMPDPLFLISDLTTLWVLVD